MKTNPNHRRLLSAFSTMTLALMCCCAALMLSSCSKKDGSSIIGKWEVPGEKTIIEFKPDGILAINTDGKAATGKYSFSDETHMKMEISIPKEELGQLPPGVTIPDSMTADAVVKINGDSLDMDVTSTMPGQPQAQVHKETSHMTRVK